MLVKIIYTAFMVWLYDIELESIRNMQKIVAVIGAGRMGFSIAKQLPREARKIIIDTDLEKAKVLATAMDKANEQFLNNDRSPSRKVGELDTRGSHFYLVLYWAQALAEQGDDQALKSKFADIAQQLVENEARIIDELNAVQGKAVDLDGYYRPDLNKVAEVMRPSETLNNIINAI